MTIRIFVVIISACFFGKCFCKQVVILDRTDVCLVPPNSPVENAAIVKTTINHCSLINATFDINRDIQRLQAAVKVLRCSNKEVLDSCAYFTSLKVNDACPLLRQKGTILSNIVYTFNPPLVCPFKKGHFEQINGTYNPDLMQFFPLDKWYWKLEMQLFDTDTKDYLIKLCVEGSVVNSLT